MDFFEHQDAARRRTSYLVWLFAAAVIAIIAAVYPVTAIAVAIMTRGQQPNQLPPPLGEILWNPMMLVGVTLGVITVVTLGSLYKLAQLRGGGRVVAEQLGGRLLDPSSADATERKILNVVEEMAIASGVPVPPVYLMDSEQAVNAFAAGFSPSDAVIGVTRGCVELLDRDELQGVMAHEFSHILNGDMKLNIRLIGILHGILIIGLLGTVLLRSAFWSSAMSGGHRRRGKNEGGGALAILAFGIALMIIGYVGVFFGNMIKSAISRQREFLADASAVQFTRYPEGIAGALKKIGGYTFGSKMLHPKAEESSHMFFGEGVSHWLGDAMSTHPPLPQRIKRIDPQWDGEFSALAPTSAMQQRADQKQQHLASRSSGVSSLTSRMQPVQMDMTEAAPLIGQIGAPTPQHIAHAAALLQGLDETVKTSARETFGARAVVYAMLLDRDSSIRDTQYQALQKNADPQVYKLTRQLTTAVSRIDPASRLLVIDLTLSALRQLSQAQYETFIKNVNALIHADKQVDLFEWTLRRIILRHLKPQFEDVRPPVVQYYNLRGVQDACATLLSVLAYVGHRDRDPAFAAFKQAAATLAPIQLSPKSPDDCSLDTLGTALDQLNELAPRPKRQVVEAAARCVAADREVTIEEVELLRAVCDTLDCPMPPLLPGQALV